MMSAITPLLHGDIKTGQNTFLTPPVSVEDLHNSRSARDFWVFVEGVGPWSAVGKKLNVVYHNPAGLDCGEYRIGEVKIDGQPVVFHREAGVAVLPRDTIAALAGGGMHRVDVKLNP